MALAETREPETHDGQTAPRVPPSKTVKGTSPIAPRELLGDGGSSSETGGPAEAPPTPRSGAAQGAAPTAPRRPRRDRGPAAASSTQRPGAAQGAALTAPPAAHQRWGPIGGVVHGTAGARRRHGGSTSEANTTSHGPSSIRVKTYVCVSQSATCHEGIGNQFHGFLRQCPWGRVALPSPTGSTATGMDANLSAWAWVAALAAARTAVQAWPAPLRLSCHKSASDLGIDLCHIRFQLLTFGFRVFGLCKCVGRFLAEVLFLFSGSCNLFDQLGTLPAQRLYLRQGRRGGSFVTGFGLLLEGIDLLLDDPCRRQLPGLSQCLVRKLQRLGLTLDIIDVWGASTIDFGVVRCRLPGSRTSGTFRMSFPGSTRAAVHAVSPVPWVSAATASQVARHSLPLSIG